MPVPRRACGGWHGGLLGRRCLQPQAGCPFPWAGPDLAECAARALCVAFCDCPTVGRALPCLFIASEHIARKYSPTGNFQLDLGCNLNQPSSHAHKGTLHLSAFHGQLWFSLSELWAGSGRPRPAPFTCDGIPLQPGSSRTPLSRCSKVKTEKAKPEKGRRLCELCGGALCPLGRCCLSVAPQLCVELSPA